MSPRSILGAFGVMAVIALGVFWYSYSRLDAAPAPFTTVEIAGTSANAAGQGRGPGAQQNQSLREQHSVPMPGQVFEDYAGQGPQGRGQQGEQERQGQGGGFQWGRKGQGKGQSGQGFGGQGFSGETH